VIDLVGIFEEINPNLRPTYLNNGQGRTELSRFDAEDAEAGFQPG